MPGALVCVTLALCVSTTSAYKKIKSVRAFLDAEVRTSSEANANTNSTAQVAIKTLFPWYHTSEELSAELTHLSTKCGGAMSVRTISKSGVDIQVARVRAPSSNPINKVFLLFGEHSRELISPETGLYFLKMLCGEAPGSEGAVAHLQDSEFELVLNGNPGSRSKVEGGDFCLRVNPSGVDLNRNWDEHFNSNLVSGGSPGKQPFSEPETQIFKELVSEYQPTAFVTVHSGTRGLYMPYAYDTSAGLGSRNQHSMLEVLKRIDEKHCKCPYGAAGKEVGYPCPGTCLDWVYDNLDTPYSFAFEIYTKPADDAELRQRWDTKVKDGALLQLHGNGGHLAIPEFKDIFEDHVSDFVQIKAHSQVTNRMRESMVCFDQFNPGTEESYNEVLRNWANAYLEMSQQIVTNLRQAPGLSHPSAQAAV